MIGRAIPIISACIVLALIGCGDTSSADSIPKAKGSGAGRSQPKVKVPSGPAPKKLVKEEMIEGHGRKAKVGDRVTLHYVGADYKTGKQFGAEWGKGRPFAFELDSGIVIPGLEEGVTGMRLGGRRQVIIPPDLAYGPNGLPPDIAPNATLVFVIDLVALK